MRYVIADEDGSLWGHIFEQDGPEVMTRWVYDRETSTIVAAMEVGGRSQNGEWWAKLSEAAMADLAESVIGANSDAIDNPEYWELRESDVLPEWASLELDPPLRP